MIGKSVRVLFDKKENGNFIGRTEFDSPEVDNLMLVDAKQFGGVYPACGGIRIGDFARVKIINAKEYDLIGELSPNHSASKILC